jgi:autotransporter-associated beta strand protein
VNLNGGVTSVATVSDTAVNSPLGAGNTVNFGGGTLEFTGAIGSTNRGIAVAAGGGTVSTPTGTTLTLAGVVSGAGTIAKSGAGTVVLTGGANTVAGYNISQGTLQVGDGTAEGSLGAGAITNNATLAFNTPAAGLIVGSVISGTGSITKTGPGNVTLNGAVDNTYAGATTVSGGSLILSSPTGINSVGGNVVVETGGIVAYGTTAGQLANHIPDTASITVNGGTFGSGVGNTEAGPTAGVFDTVANVTVNSGTFLSGRGDAQVFGITGALNAAGGRVFLQRGGSVAATSISLASGVVLDMDGGSTGFISRLGVGTGGLTINGATVNMNTGSNVTAGSQGSSIILTGDLTTTGTTAINRISTQVAPRANIDVNGADRVFNITGTLTLGTSAAQVIVVNTGATPGGIVKQGPGTLVLNGANTYNGNTDIFAGTVTLTGSLSGSATINVATGATFDVAGAAGFTVDATQTIKGNGNVVGSANINGTLAPGSSIGTLNFANNVVFGASGIGAFEINKTGLVRTADLANVTGALTLAGTLNVTATGDALIEGDEFNLFDAASFSGTMAIGTMPTLAPGLSWDVADLGVDGTISVIPEPGSAALLALGSALLFRRRRKA